MKKTPKKTKKNYTTVYIAILSLVVIVIVFFLAYFSKMSKMPSGSQNTNTQAVMNGQQTATITILPSGSVPPDTKVIAVERDPSSTQQDSHVESHMNMAENTGSISAGTRVKYKISSFKKLALQPLEFEVFDENGKAYGPKDLKVVHEHEMHFIVVSANLKEFQHLHPAYSGGKWKVLANLPNPGTYYAYVDIAPVKGNPVVLRSNLTVQKETSGTITYPGLTPDLLAITKGYKAELKINPALALQQSVFSYHITKDGKDSVLANYLGAIGHVVIFRQGNVDSFMHIHPMDSSNAQKGMAEFMATFVKGGRYTAFAEFKVGSTVYTFPITFDING